MILVTGATGFVGQALIEALMNRDCDIVAAVRHGNSGFKHKVKQVNVGDLLSTTDWSVAFKAVDIVVHTAARVHVMQDDSTEPLTEFCKVNTDGTLNLARQAAIAGVKRFVFISSIKVNGESTELGHVFLPGDEFVPNDPYALSKYETEQGLMALAKETGMEVVIIRPPLVYGPKVKGNFALILKWIDKGPPLPFGGVDNKRSLIALDNLISFIVLCIDHPKAANEIFLISDNEDVSTTELLQKVAKSFGKKALLVPVSIGLIKFFAKLLGKGYMVSRLFGSLQVDSSKARDLLGWKPVITMEEQLKKTAIAYLNGKASQHE